MSFEICDVSFMNLKAEHIFRLKELNVDVVYLFGSYAENVQHSLSDLDIGIVLQNEEQLRQNSFERYNEFYDLFTEVFSQFDSELDIVFLNTAPLELQFDVVRHGKVLFEISQEERLSYEDRIQMLSMDFHPLLQEMNAAVLEKIV